jgi:hypothetical protein
MRIQETNSILKEARIARHQAGAEHHDDGFVSRAWRMVSSLPDKLTSFFRK